MRITSRKNPLLLELRQILSSPSYGKEKGVFVGEGWKLLHSAMAASFSFKQIIVTEDWDFPSAVEDVPIIIIPEDLMNWLSPQKTPQGVLFLVEIPKVSLTTPQGNYLILDGVQDPGNVGTLWRTAQGLGATALVLLTGCANPWGHKTIRSSMGACFHLPAYEMSREEAVDIFRDYPLYATALDLNSKALGEVSLTDCAVVLGSEGQGVSPELLAECNETIYLPMAQGCQSLNVAMMGGIVLWEMAKGKQ
ncbi:MAG: RNA methyltransferase [Eubacteriales bacterium]